MAFVETMKSLRPPTDEARDQDGPEISAGTEFFVDMTCVVSAIFALAGGYSGLVETGSVKSAFMGAAVCGAAPAVAAAGLYVLRRAAERVLDRFAPPDAQP